MHLVGLRGILSATKKTNDFKQEQHRMVKPLRLSGDAADIRYCCCGRVPGVLRSGVSEMLPNLPGNAADGWN